MDMDPIDGYLVGKDDVTFKPHEPLPDPRHETCALEVAFGKKTHKVIASEMGVSLPTISSWVARDEVKARIGHIRAEITASMIQYGIANRDTRLLTLQEMHDDYIRIVQERATAAMTDPNAKGIPGAETGRLTMTIKKIGYGDHAERITEWSFDKTVHNALMEVDERMARETGQWSEKSETKTESVVHVFKGIDVDKV